MEMIADEVNPFLNRIQFKTSDDRSKIVFDLGKISNNEDTSRKSKSNFKIV